jgi:ribonuclease P protein component
VLSKINRLKKKNDFDSIFKNGKSLKDSFLVFKFTDNNSKTSRFGFIIPKTVSKKAVVRNKIRRRISSILSKELSNIKNSVDGVFIVLAGFEKKDFLETEKIVKDLLKKSKIIK